MTLDDFRKDLAAYHESPGSASGPYEIGGEDAAEISEQLKQVLALVSIVGEMVLETNPDQQRTRQQCERLQNAYLDMIQHGDIEPPPAPAKEGE